MIITDAKYLTDKYNTVVSIMFTVDGKEMSVPVGAVGNTDYDEILRQVEAGTLTIADAD